MEGQTLGNAFCSLLVLPVRYECYDPKTIGYFVPLHEIFFQAQSNFNGISVNLKWTTEGQEAMNIMCSHKDN